MKESEHGEGLDIPIGSSPIRPAHYGEGREHEPIDVIRDWGLNFDLGNVVKYISRVGRKDQDATQDLEKARYYLNHEIAARLALAKKTSTKPACPIMGCVLQAGHSGSCVGQATDGQATNGRPPAM